MKKNDIYKLKRCLRDFKTNGHLCLFHDLLSFELSFQNGLLCPLMLGLGSFFLFFLSSLGWASSYRLFLWEAQFFWTFWFFSSWPQLCLDTFDYWEFSFMPPSVTWTLSIIEVFFAMSLTLSPSVGCDPSQGYFQKILLSSKGVCKGYILASWKDYQIRHFLISNACI